MFLLVQIGLRNDKAKATAKQVASEIISENVTIYIEKGYDSLSGARNVYKLLKIPKHPGKVYPLFLQISHDFR